MRLGLRVVTFLFLLTGIGFSQSAYVPEDLALGGGLTDLEKAFDAATDPLQQVIITKMIVAVDNDDKYPVLMDIVMADLKGAEMYGQVNNTALEARKVALEAVAATGSMEYSVDYLTILQYDSDLDTRLLAAQALGLIKDDDIVVMLTQLLKTKYNIIDFTEEDETMYNDDLVCEGIIVAMGVHGSPKYFTALLEVVTLRNHREATIQAAWDAMQNLAW